MARDLGELNREDFARYKDDVKKDGKPFFPCAMFHDTVMSLVVVSVIVALACDLVLRRGRRRSPGSSGRGTRSRPIPGRRTSSRGRTGTSTSSSTSCGSSSGRRRSFIATVGIPTICLILLIGLPFFDRRRERRPLHRPGRDGRRGPHVLSMAVLTWKGATAKEALGSELVAARARRGPRSRASPDNEEAAKGAELFAQSGCLNCHTYLGAGQREPRRARPLARSAQSNDADVLRPVPDEPGRSSGTT